MFCYSTQFFGFVYATFVRNVLLFCGLVHFHNLWFGFVCFCRLFDSRIWDCSIFVFAVLQFHLSNFGIQDVAICGFWECRSSSLFAHFRIFRLLDAGVWDFVPSHMWGSDFGMFRCFGLFPFKNSRVVDCWIFRLLPKQCFHCRVPGSVCSWLRGGYIGTAAAGRPH